MDLILLSFILSTVNRLHCKGATFEAELVVDVNCELFDVRANETVSVLLASRLTNAPDDGSYNPRLDRRSETISKKGEKEKSSSVEVTSSLMDNYDYVMHGRVFSIKYIENQRIEVQASFGGLLLRLRGEQAHLENFTVDMT
jgi:DNA-directed RNA polymerase I, II, and III subunit RPABC3